MNQKIVICWQCRGTALYNDIKCHQCEGRGRLLERTEITYQALTANDLLKIYEGQESVK